MEIVVQRGYVVRRQIFGEDSVKDGCCGIKRVEDIPWIVPWLWCGNDEVCSGNQCQLLVKG